MNRAKTLTALTVLALGVLLVASTGCDSVENQVMDTILFALRITDVWV